MTNREALFSVLGLFVLFAGTFALFVFHDLSYSELRRKFIAGHHGVELVAWEGENPSFEPWELLERNLSFDEMLRELCEKAHLSPNCARQRGVHFRLFSTEHRVERAGGGSYVLERGVAPLARENITPELVDGRMRLVSAWAKANIRPDDTLPYLYFPSSDTYSENNNAIRQFLTVHGLFALANTTGDEELHELGERVQERLMADLYREESDFSSIYDYDDESPLGAAALAILAERERVPDASLSEEERLLGEHVLRMQRGDGSFQTFLESATSTENDRFYSGEALLALARLYEASGDERYADALLRSFAHYRQKLAIDFSPQYTPWHMMAYALASQLTDEDEYVAYVYWLAEGLIETMLENDPHALPDEVGRFFNPEYPDWGPPHSSSTGIYLEGLTYAYELAAERGDETKAERYRAAILAGTRALLQIQWTPETAYYVRYPERVVGSFKTSITNNNVRIDQLGHAANALVRVRALLFAD